MRALVIGLLLVAAPASAQTTPEQAAVIAGDPKAEPQVLALTDVPKATGPARELFNGRDLADWEPWLGYADPITKGFTMTPLNYEELEWGWNFSSEQCVEGMVGIHGQFLRSVPIPQFPPTNTT